MAKFTHSINALNAGEWSPLLDARQDLGGYAASASKLENFIPTIQGPIVKRAGSGFVREVKNSTARTWLVPFVVSQTESYMLEFGDNYIRSYSNRSANTVYTALGGTNITNITQANPAVITLSPAPVSAGFEIFVSGVSGMTEVNNRWFKTANVSGSTFELTTIHGDNVDSTGYSAYVASGADKTAGPRETYSPYTSANLVNANGEFNLDFVQFGNTMYLTHRDGTVPPQKLVLTYATTFIADSSDTFTFSELQPDDGPFLPLNSAPTDTMYVSAATGSITITASSSLFTADDVGSLIRIDQEIITSTNGWKTGTAYTAGEYIRSEGKEYKAATSGTSGTKIPAHTSGTVNDGEGVGSGGATGVDWEYVSSGYGIARITAQTGATATATVLTTFPQTLIGATNAASFWRMGAWTAANGYPTCLTLFRERLCLGQGLEVQCSNAAQFESFALDSFGEILTENAVTVVINVDRATAIHNLASGGSMVAMTRSGEYSVGPSTTSSPFGPNNVRTGDEGLYGSQPISPVRVGPSVLFMQSGGRKMRSMQYSDGMQNYVSPDMTVRSSHITAPRITAMAWQGNPYETLWGVRSDGEMVTFSYDQSNEVRAWARHTLGGVVEHVASMPSPGGDRDDVWVIVKRTINGAERRYIEYLQEEYSSGSLTTATYADSMLLYNGAAATTLYGFDHLEGETIQVLADGGAVPDVTISNGEIVLADAATVVSGGYGYTAVYGSNRQEGGAAEGSSQGKTKRITDATIRVINTLGGKTGPSETNADDIPELNYRNPSVLMGSAPDVYSGDTYTLWPSGYETDGKIFFIHDSLFPATVCGIYAQSTVMESR